MNDEKGGVFKHFRTSGEAVMKLKLALTTRK